MCGFIRRQAGQRRADWGRFNGRACRVEARRSFGEQGFGFKGGYSFDRINKLILQCGGDFRGRS